jgi:hypothetical protein
MLRDLSRRFVSELNLERRPLASHHHPNRVKPDHHAVLVLLPASPDAQVGENISKVGSLSLNSGGHLGRLVIELQVPCYVFISNSDSGRVQDDIDQRTDIFGIETLAEV